jgi:hypothetical protein
VLSSRASNHIPIRVLPPQGHCFPPLSHLAGELWRGGAIVTVNAGMRSVQAKAILERNRGTIRYEADAFTPNETWEAGKAESVRVRVFGHVQRIYPNGAGSDQPARKAS